MSILDNLSQEELSAALEAMPLEARAKVVALLKRRKQLSHRANPVSFAQHCAETAELSKQVTWFQKEWMAEGVLWERHDDGLPYPVPGIHVIFAPRDHGKSKWHSLIYPTWIASENPDFIRSVIASGNVDGGVSLVKDIDILVNSDEYKQLYGNMKSDPRDPDGAWNNYQKTLVRSTPSRHPTFYATGATGGRVTGRRATLAVCDDLVNRDNVKTRASREEVRNFILQTLLPVVDAAVGQVLIVGTPWHYDDAYAYFRDLTEDSEFMSLVEELGFPGVTFRIYQAIMDEGTVHEKAMWEDRFPLPILYGKRQTMGSIWFNCQYQCDPSGLAGLVLKSEWLHDATAEEMEESKDWPLYVGIDLAISERDAADFTSLTFVRAKKDKGVLLDVIRFKEDTFPERRIMENIYNHGRPAKIACESNHFQSLVAQNLIRLTRLPIVKSRTRRSKRERFITMSAHFENERIKVNPADTPGLAAFRSEWAAFDAGEHDDTLDSTELSLQVARFTPLSIYKSSKQPRFTGRG